MCGIYGIAAATEGRHPDPRWLELMGDITIHRGPDDEGTFSEQGIALGMRRLSIIDLASGHQPICNEEETVRVVCNGEIYNYRELRERLRSNGHRFRTTSDSEVIVHLYEEHGLDCVHHLNGMFAFAIWDSVHKRLVLGRDRLGVKPLYYRHDQDWLAFGSEAKALLQLPFVEPDLDRGALREYLALGYTGSAQSIFRGIRKLPPATLLVHEREQVTLHQYWHIPTEVAGGVREQDWSQRLLDLLEDVIASEMVSDVPIGAFLSGGIDSSCVVALMARHSARPVNTYAIGFDGGTAGAYYNELPYAREVADFYKTRHREIIVRPNVAELLPRLLWHMDEPVADSAFITTFLVSEFARQDVKVILSGVGGDELFGGYNRYLGEYYNRLYSRLPALVRRGIVEPLVAQLPSDRHAPLTNKVRYARAFLASREQPLAARYRSYLEVCREDTIAELIKEPSARGPDALDLAFERAAGCDSLQGMMHVDLLSQLPNDLLMLTDKMTMAASLECRVPLVNPRLVELAAQIPSHIKIADRRLKSLFISAIADLLPPSVLRRRKRGFGAPIGAWLKNELSPLTHSLLSHKAIERRGWLAPDAVKKMITLHQTKKEDCTDILMSLICLELWARLYIDGTQPDVLAEDIKELCAA